MPARLSSSPSSAAAPTVPASNSAVPPVDIVGAPPPGLPHVPLADPLANPPEPGPGQELPPSQLYSVDEGYPAVQAGFVETASPLCQSFPYGDPGLIEGCQPSEPSSLPPKPQRGIRGAAAGLWADILADHGNFYSCRGLMLLTAGVGTAAIIANTSADEAIRDAYQENVRSTATDEYSEAMHTPKISGNGKITLPVFAGAFVLGSMFEEGTLGDGLGDWGERSLRTVLVGFPPMLGLQYVTGGSRPGEHPDGSNWHPFSDSNGVSGHAFMGAIPFLSAAKMVDSPFWKTAFYAASTLPGLSRVNDDAHYFSQSLLGWWIAYLAATAVDQTETPRGPLSFGAVPVAGGLGLGFELRR